MRELSDRDDREHIVEVLRDAVVEMERRESASIDDRIEADLNFHRKMCQLTGNETLVHSWQSLEGSTRMSIMFAGVDRGIRNMDAGRHLDIVDAIATGDAEKAAATVAQHMDVAAETLVS